MTDEIQDLTDQLGEGSRRTMEMEKTCKRIEIERDEMRGSVEEMEATLGQEVAKLQRSQIDINALRTELERRLAEKDEEIENIR